MSEAEKTIRLSKVARELNIGVHTIVDFLSSKGVKVDNNPNAKIGEDGYRLLLKEFQSEKTAKEESQLLILTSPWRRKIRMMRSLLRTILYRISKKPRRRKKKRKRKKRNPRR
jgi:hypothetical protein